MIKKTTTAKFVDGPYVGDYDWKGGMPLSEGEVMSVYLESKSEPVVYVLSSKCIELHEEGEDQLVSVSYQFKMQ
ncbi:MAG: hypothetical protein U9Q03_05695 [Patescibacteria group bacterium]|nr:hypothetical protein [Patescibacteria group bacterium]